jgi:SNF2 family DNA or RNA helicase
MGLGKTLQAICLLRLAYERSRTREHSLVLAPKSVLHHWQREIERFYPDIRVCQYHGSQRRSGLFQTLEPIVFISTYATILNDIDKVSQIPFYYVILDEATQIKNTSARRTQAVKSLNAAHRLALSGTPVENRPSELWSLFDFLMRGHLGKQATFARLFEGKISAGDRKASQQLGRRIKPFMLRRKKEEVAKDLPDKIHMDEWCTLSPEQRALYGGLQDEVQRLRTALQRGKTVNYTSSILPVLTKLKQMAL